ncbi:hypothetical protein CI807_21255 [Pseudomonas sp. NS1(2017)]|nr:hypothetical protein CI807_21255 [Pseudomonas sp. NS1(2017)]
MRCAIVGASLLAKVVNDNAGNLKRRGDVGFLASKLAPTHKRQACFALKCRAQCATHSGVHRFELHRFCLPSAPAFTN